MRYLMYYGSSGLLPIGSAPGPISLPQVGADADPRSVGDAHAVTGESGLTWDDGWIAATLLNGWVPGPGGAYAATSYRKTIGGLVSVRGYVANGSSGSAVIFQLPAGYRPSTNTIHPGTTAPGSGTACRIDVAPSGNVTPASASTEWVGFHFSFWAG